MSTEKIPIVIPSYNRPEFLIQVINGLRNCDNIDLFKIYTSEEPGFPQVQKIFEDIDFVQIERHINSSRLGCNANVIQSINIGFQHNDYVVVLEDDVVPGKDFLNLCLWARDLIKEDPELFCVTGFELLPAPNFINHYGLVRRKKWFLPWGWATNIDKWNNCVKNVNGQGNETWDCNLSVYHFNPNNLYSLQPEIARVKNIGYYGLCTPSESWFKIHMEVQCFTDDNPEYFKKQNEFIYDHSIIV